MDAAGMRGRKTSCTMEYLRERRDGEVQRVNAVSVRGRPPVKCKDSVGIHEGEGG